jgi:hypothetical protein
MPRVCKSCGREAAEAAYCPFCSKPTIEYVPYAPTIELPARLSRSDALTIRKLFERRKRWITAVIIGCILMALGGALLASLLKISPVYSFIPFFAVFVITIIFAQSSAFHCPLCDKNLNQLVMQGNFMGIDQNIRYCPFCGVGLDVEIDPESHKPMELLKEKWEQRGLENKNKDIQVPPAEQKANTDIQLPPG